MELNLKTQIVIEKLKSIGVIQYGEFLLKSGAYSNYYCDFRILISYPRILESIYRLIPENVFDGIDLVCGVYFGGVPLANLISFQRNIPQIFIRDTEKKHGTKKQVEGIFHKGQTVLLIEDVITTGGSVIEKMKILESYGLNIVVFTILNRNENIHGRISTDENHSYKMHSILPLSHIIQNTSIDGSNRIYKIAFQKKSNIVLSVDMNKSEDIIQLIEETKQNIIGIKIHSDIIVDFPVLREYLNTLGDDLIVIEDCKVADISFISIQKIQPFVEYADYITYHCLLGKDLPLSLKKEYPNLGLLGVVEMSVRGSLITPSYIQSTEEQLDVMDGCVIQKEGLRLFQNKLPITFSPGISISHGTDNYNQSYRNPMTEKDGIGEFWIVGRGIYQSTTPSEESRKYREIGWNHFIHR